MSKTEQQDGMPTWRKSGYSIANGSCAQVGVIPGNVMVRDSVDPFNVQLRFPSGAWQEFIAHLKAA